MSKTIYALASGVGRSGVGVVRISGDNAFDFAKQLGVKNFTPNKLARTNLFANNGDLIDEAMAVAFKNPNSFTGEDVVELHIHGSQAILNVLFDELDKQGARLAEPGEFSKRAFANNKMDLTQAEGLIDLINAETKAQMRQAQRQTQGALRDLYNSWADELLPLLAHCEAYIDFPDEDLPESVKKQTDEKIQNLIYRKIRNPVLLVSGCFWSIEEKIDDPNAVVKSPIVGTAYLSPEPGAKPFVSVGKKIKKGDIIVKVEDKTITKSSELLEAIGGLRRRKNT